MDLGDPDRYVPVTRLFALAAMFQTQTNCFGLIKR
jgi:hypothetical protein